MEIERSPQEALPIQDQPLQNAAEEPVQPQAPADWHELDSHPVFVIEDSFFRTRTPRPLHWSIAWSDLMMTMFVLFLTLFVYQLAHREFLSKEEVDVVAGQTMPIPPPPDTASRPFHPIYPQVSDKKADKLKKVERITPTSIEQDTVLRRKDIPVHDILTQDQAIVKPLITDIPKQEGSIEPKPMIEAGELVEVDVMTKEADQKQPGKPAPGGSEQTREELITEIYDLSKTTLTSEKLERFASVELIPDKTIRIILTGDLLFNIGQADLTSEARQSLMKLAPVIQQTPYMINVIGHTDSVPMHSPQYPTNWELSLARASMVARFLIEELNMPASQFVVSGFSYYRPIKPNTNAANRRANRRVEIILSKELPPARKATPSIIQ